MAGASRASSAQIGRKLAGADPELLQRQGVLGQLMAARLLAPIRASAGDGNPGDGFWAVPGPG